MDQEDLKAVLAYDPDTGVFTWVARPGRRCVIGAPVGSPTAAGYLRVRVNNKLHYLHRLAWLYVTGVWPKNHIDHINGDVADNRFVNLRDVDRFTNLQNERKARKHNVTGLLGAHFRRDTGKFAARIRVDGACLILGQFTTAEEAHHAYIAAKRQYHKGNTL